MAPADVTAGGGHNLIGQVIDGRYEVTGKLGKGGMAVVYSALDRNLGRAVALKVLRTDVASDPVAAKRLVREARAAGQLHHPNIITMHDVGDADGMIYIAMEVLTGKELSEVMEEQGAIGLLRSIDIARQVAGALAVAHAHGIIHRDIKPENLFLCTNAGSGDFVKVLDFSIAKLPTNMVTAALTRAGSVFGTPHYMAPEQVEGREVSPQTDIYALGAVIYESIVGAPPFDGNSVIDILLQHVRRAPPRLDAGDRKLPKGLADLVESMLAKKATDRPTSAQEIERILEGFLEEARAIEGETNNSDPADVTFKLDSSAVAMITAAASAAERSAVATSSAPTLAPPPLPGSSTAARAPTTTAKPPLPTTTAAEPTRGRFDGSGDLPFDLPNDEAAMSVEVAMGGRTIMGHGLADQVRAETAKIEAARAKARQVEASEERVTVTTFDEPAAATIAPPPPGRASVRSAAPHEGSVQAPTSVGGLSRERIATRAPPSAPPPRRSLSRAPSAASTATASQSSQAQAAKTVVGVVPFEPAQSDAARAAKAETLVVSRDQQALLSAMVAKREAEQRKAGKKPGAGATASGDAPNSATAGRNVDAGTGDLGTGDLGTGDLGTGDLGTGDLGTGDPSSLSSRQPLIIAAVAVAVLVAGATLAYLLLA